MKRLIFALSLLLTCIACFSQNSKDLLLGTNLDLIKSDYDGYFEKAQAGLEGNYFFSEKFAATGGVEVWTRTGVSAVIGARWYPIRDAFIRARGLIGENDISAGAGWAKPITEDLRFEAMADFYFQGTFCIRAGIAFHIKNRK